MASVFVKVKCSDRLPKIGDSNITTFANSESGASTFSVVTKRIQDFILENKEYWLEEIELPSEEDINKFWCIKFRKGANYILNKMKND